MFSSPSGLTSLLLVSFLRMLSRLLDFPKRARMSQAYDYLTPYPVPIQTLTLTDGTQVAVTDTGAGRETLVLVHGLSSSLMVWQKNLAQLGQHFRCVAIDLPGYGRSPRAPRTLDMIYFSSVVMEVIYRMGIRQANLVGHSMGGQVSMTTALRYPHSIRRLILAAPAGLERFNRLQAAALRKSFKPEALAKATRESITKNVRYSLYRFEPDAQFMIEDRVNLAETPHFDDYCHTVSESVSAMTNGPVWEYLPHIMQETLILMGENDPLIPNRLFSPMLKPRQVAEAGAARIAHSTLQMVPRCGHFVPFEQPDLFNDAVRDFVFDEKMINKD